MKQAPAWWVRYGKGGFGSPSAVYRAALSERRLADGPDTSFVRFEGDADTLDAGSRFTVWQRLQAPSYHNSDYMLRLHQSADWRTVHPVVMAFTARFIRAARKRQIPLYVQAAFLPDAVGSGFETGLQVSIMHARFYNALSAMEWAFLEKLGNEIAVKAELPVVSSSRSVWRFSGVSDFSQWPVPPNKLLFTPERLWSLYCRYS